MQLIEIQRGKALRKFREGNYSISVRLEHPGDEFREFLRINISEDGKIVAKALFKQWQGKTKWEPLNINITENSKKGTLREMIYTAAANAGFFIKE